MINKFILQTLSTIENSRINLYIPEVDICTLQNDSKCRSSAYPWEINSNTSINYFSNNQLLVKMTFFMLMDSYIDLNYPTFEGMGFQEKYKQLNSDTDSEIMFKMIYRIMIFIRNAITHENNSIIYDERICIKRDKGSFECENNKFHFVLSYIYLAIKLDTFKNEKYTRTLLKTYYNLIIKYIKFEDQINESFVKEFSDDFSLGISKRTLNKYEKPSYTINDSSIDITRIHGIHENLRDDYLIDYEKSKYIIPDEFFKNNKNSIKIEELHKWEVTENHFLYDLIKDQNMSLNMNAGLDISESSEVKNYLDNSEKNTYLRNPQKGLELCANLVAKGRSDCEEILDDINRKVNEFVTISEEDDNTTGAMVYKKLQGIKEDLNSIISFPQLENKYTVAVGGGFSSGKSRFLNTVLGLKDLLPTDTDPTTSISTYITNGNNENYYALNNYNNRIKIDAKAIQAISHEFKAKYNVTFSHILKLITIEQANLKYPNLIFLDTPGYSKPDANFADTANRIDENIARDHLRSADYIIWLVDCQTPVKNEDLEFIKSLDFDKPILFVLNKADKKPHADIAKQVEVSKMNLIKKRIPFVDVIGFSAAENREYSESQNILKQFLTQLAEGKSGTKILRRTQRVFDEYLSFYDTGIQELRNNRGVINNIVLSDELSSEHANSIAAIGSQYKKKIDALQKNNRTVKGIAAKISGLITELLLKKDIEISSEFTECEFNIKKSSAGKKETLRFNGSIKIKDKSGLTEFKDMKTIPATIRKISSIGVFLVIKGLDSDLVVSNGELKKVAGKDFADIINKNSTVKVQIVSDSKCVVLIDV